MNYKHLAALQCRREGGKRGRKQEFLSAEGSEVDLKPSVTPGVHCSNSAAFLQRLALESLLVSTQKPGAKGRGEWWFWEGVGG